MIFDMEEGLIGDGLIPYPDYVFGVQPAQLNPVIDRDFIQASFDPSEEVGGSVDS